LWIIAVTSCHDNALITSSAPEGGCWSIWSSAWSYEQTTQICTLLKISRNCREIPKTTIGGTNECSHNLMRVLTKCQTITFIMNSRDELSWLSNDSSAPNGGCRYVYNNRPKSGQTLYKICILSFCHIQYFTTEEEKL
jgi:hypothetical protein